MARGEFPSNAVLCSALAERVESVLAESGEHLREIIRLILAAENRLLSAEPQAHSSILVAAACVSAGGEWQQALWPCVAMEYAMAAADMFDDVADGEATALRAQIGAGGLLMGAAGLLAFAPHLVLRATEDGVPLPTVVDLIHLLSEQLAEAADGQARSHSAPKSTDAVEAYQLAAAKSGPLGSLAAQLGARIASADPDLLEKYTTYGWHLAVFSQLLNDARDAGPGGPDQKRDVRAGSRTVPLVFARSAGAPPGLHGAALSAWEARERERIAAQGGVLAAVALAEAERERGLAALDSLEMIGQSVGPLRQLFDWTA